MVKEIWTKTNGLCKEDPISRNRILDKNMAAKKEYEKNKVGVYKKVEKKIDIDKLKDMNNKITGISENKNNRYIHTLVDTNSKNGINFNNNLSAKQKEINFKDYTCYAPIHWDEYVGKCDGDKIISKVQNLEIKEGLKKMNNYYDVKCKEECLNDKKCNGFSTIENKCTKYYGNIISGDNDNKHYCKVKPEIYKYDNYDQIDKLYKTQLNSNNKIITDLNNKLDIDKKKIVDVANEYMEESMKNINNDIKNNEKGYENNLELKNKYFHTLFNFHKEQTKKNNIDKKSTGVIDDIYHLNKNNLSKNNKIIKNIDQHLDTVNRQGSIILQAILKRDKLEIFLKLLVLYLVIFILLLFFKKINIIRDNNIIRYIMFFITILMGGLVFVRFTNSHNRSKYNYQNKVFKHKDVEINNK